MSISNIKYKSYFQTTDVIVNSQKNGLIYNNGFEMTPVCPVKLNEKPIRINKDGVIYTWYLNGTVERIDTQVKTIWFSKPTIKDAFIHSKDYPNSKTYFEFRSNGFIRAFYFEKEYIWFSEEDAKHVEGVFIEGTFCSCNDFIFDGEQCDYCDYNSSINSFLLR